MESLKMLSMRAWLVGKEVRRTWGAMAQDKPMLKEKVKQVIALLDEIQALADEEGVNADE